MITVAEPVQVIPEREPRPLPLEQRFVLRDADWLTYEKFLEAVGERRIRLTYDRGILEIMTVSGVHEWWKSRLSKVVFLLGYFFKQDIQSYGSMTLRRQDQNRGLEPDECFYIRNAARMVGPRNIDLTRDPAPDLGVEIDISRSWLDRVGVYAALGVAEVWRFDGESLLVYHLRPDGSYATASQSLSFPSLPLAAFAEFLRHTAGVGDSALLDVVREWVQRHVPSDTSSGSANA